MGKVIHEYLGILFDSIEEIWFAKWCEELRLNGFIISWHKETKSMELCPEVKFDYVKTTPLKTKVKTENKSWTLLREITYTADFTIIWSIKGWEQFCSPLSNPNKESLMWAKSSIEETFVEVKPHFDQNNMTRDFITKQKFIYDKLKIFVNLVFPEQLFKETFMPLDVMSDFKYKKSPTGKNKGKRGPGDWKTDYIPKSLKEYLNG